jgi:uncharacterized protein (TIGR02444 family)
LAHIGGQLNYDNKFWRFSLAVYGRAEVAKECLALQDAYGINVNILLFCAWLGSQSIVLNHEDIEAVLRAVAGWHDDIVRPLLTVRQRMKDFSDDDKLRTSIKAIELKAEQTEQAMLFAFSRDLQRGKAQGDCVAANIRQYMQIKSPKATVQASAIHLIDAARRFG